VKRIALVALALALSGCGTFSWPWNWSRPDFERLSEYTERPRSYLEICLEHAFLVRVKPWERAVLSRTDMQWVPDPLEGARRNHTFWSKEASMPGGSAAGGGCGCN
jgi:hypothetical protein